MMGLGGVGSHCSQLVNCFHSKVRLGHLVIVPIVASLNCFNSKVARTVRFL